jgi:glycosyltransferase involved in cell wall biosynthesis
MRKVLMIAPYFVPRRRVGALRPFKFAIQMKELGWEPVILTIAENSEKLTEKEKFLLDGIKIIEINTPFDQTTRLKTPGGGKNKSQLVSHISSWIDKNIPFDSWIFLFWFNYLGILSKVKELNPELIWCTGDPWSGLWLGEKLSRDLSKHFVADFRDPWTITDVNLRDRSAFSEEMDRRAEKRIVEIADKLIFTSKATERAYQNHYGLKRSNTAVIYNSYDPVLFEDPGDESWDYEPDPENLHILFFGRFRRLSPAEPIMNAISYLSKTDPAVAGKIRIHSFGELDPEEAKKIASLGVAQVFVQHKPVVPQKTLSVLNKADLLLVSTDRNRKNIIPAKLWDYLATEKPILSIAPNAEITRILEAGKAGFGFHPDEIAEISAFLKKCLKAKQQGTKLSRFGKDGYPKREIFESRNTTQQLLSVFDEIIGYE